MRADMLPIHTEQVAGLEGLSETVCKATDNIKGELN